MGAYDFNFDLPDDESLVPNREQVRAMQALMPAEPFALVPQADDRNAWSSWQHENFGQLTLATARELADQAFPQFDNATWLASLEQQDATEAYGKLGLLRQRQSVFLLAEAIFDQGEFLGLIESDIRAISKLNTWIHPSNDQQRLNFDGKTIDSDLASLHFAENFALTDYVLGAQLTNPLRSLIRHEVDRRLFTPLRQRIESGRDIDWWINVNHNWNASCLACVAHTATSLLDEASERAWWLTFAHANILKFRDSFADDGFCSEGVGYWGGGFARFIVMSELLRVATGDIIDLFADPRMAISARFALRTEIQPGVYPAFADAHLNLKPPLWVSLWIENRRGTPPLPVEPLPDGLDPQPLPASIGAPMWMFHTRAPLQPVQLVNPPALRNWFAQSTLLISRPAVTTNRAFAATFLGGNNGVNHNHNDLGTFTVVLDGKTLILDPGLETYSYRTFSEQRYDSQLLNSYGHPVPRIGGQLQATGPTHQATTLVTEFTDEIDRMVLDLRRAYDCPTLRKLEREFIFDRRGDGSLTITDTVEFSEPTEYESALISLGKITESGTTLRFSEGDTAITIDYSESSIPLNVSRDTINQTPHPTRVALSPSGPICSALLQVIIRPA